LNLPEIDMDALTENPMELPCGRTEKTGAFWARAPAVIAPEATRQETAAQAILRVRNGILSGTRMGKPAWLLQRNQA
jgi:hypothetical protein